MALLLWAGAFGCGNIAAQRAVTDVARHDHNCPPEQINIVRKLDDGAAYDVEVCGRMRTYRDDKPDDKHWVFTETRARRRSGAADRVEVEHDPSGSGDDTAGELEPARGEESASGDGLGDL